MPAGTVRHMAGKRHGDLVLGARLRQQVGVVATGSPREAPDARETAFPNRQTTGRTIGEIRENHAEEPARNSAESLEPRRMLKNGRDSRRSGQGFPGPPDTVPKFPNGCEFLNCQSRPLYRLDIGRELQDLSENVARPVTRLPKRRPSA